MHRNDASISDQVWLSIRQAADHTGASTDTIRRRISDGQLLAYYLGKSYMLRIKTHDLDALMRPVRTSSARSRGRPERSRCEQASR